MIRQYKRSFPHFLSSWRSILSWITLMLSPPILLFRMKKYYVFSCTLYSFAGSDFMILSRIIWYLSLLHLLKVSKLFLNIFVPVTYRALYNLQGSAYAFHFICRQTCLWKLTFVYLISPFRALCIYSDPSTTNLEWLGSQTFNEYLQDS